jgi:hypothetical protein
MKGYYNDENLAIGFTTDPHIGVRYCLPSSTVEEKKSIKKYPFINKSTLTCHIFDKKAGKHYSFVIPKGYCYDGATIPRIFWRVIGSNTDNAFLIAALVHDTLCENHGYIDNDRQLSTDVFVALLQESEVPGYKRFLMKHSVNMYQALFGGW